MLFIIPSFQHGGTNRSFCNMIDLFDFEAHGIAIDLLTVKGMTDKTYLNEFKNRNINILHENYGLSLAYYNGTNLFRRILKKLINSCPDKLLQVILFLSCLKYNNKYCSVVSMEEGVSTRVTSYIKSPKKIAWLRCMYDRYFELTHHKDESGVYDKIDKIVCVSEECQKSLLTIYPQYKDKTLCIPNTQNRELILKKSEQAADIDFENDIFNIVSVGRLDEVKQFHLIPEIVKKLLEQNLKLKWYIIGDGYYQKEIAEAIKKHKVEDTVLLVGSKSNPYPLMSKADLIAVTSVSESFCNVITEGKILNRQIISTAFPAVFNTMGSYSKGIICSIDDFAKKIYDLYNSPFEYSDVLITKNKDDKDITDFVQRLEKVF